MTNNYSSDYPNKPRVSLDSIKYNFTRQDENAASKNLNQQIEHDNKPQKQVNPNDVLNFLGARNSDIKINYSTKSIDKDNYINGIMNKYKDDIPATEARAAKFLEQFDSDFNEAQNIAVQEFNVNETTASNIALAYINNSYRK